MACSIFRKRQRQTSLEDLPQDLIERILAWLPASSFFRLRSVSKRWRSTSSSPTFSRSCSDVPSREPWFLMSGPSDFLHSFVFDSSDGNWRKIPRAGLLRRCCFTPVAAGGSLVCFFSAGGSLAVCNPVTGSCRELPRSSGQLCAEEDEEKIHAIALTSSRSSYRVFVISGDFPSNLHLKTYDSVSERWAERQLSGVDLDLAGGDTEYFLSKEGEVFAAKTQRSPCKKYSAAVIAGKGEQGEMQMFFLSHGGVVVVCDLGNGNFSEFPRLLPASVEHSFDVAECLGEMMVAALSEIWDSASLRIWRFCKRERQWRQAAAMPPAMSRELGGVHADISCVGLGEAVLVSVSSASYSRHFICDVAADRWSELPDCCVDGAPVEELRSAFAFEPRLEALV